jgi:3-hydroxybutyryl-CoA dehydrogenase
MRPEDVRKVAVIGAGTMGHGIAQTFALAGYQVTMNARHETSLSAAMAKIGSNLEMLEKNGIAPAGSGAKALQNLRTTTVRSDAVREADFVIESATEDPVVKKEIFGQLAQECSDWAILSTNTSSISVTEMTAGVKNSSRCVGMHWWNPPHLMPLVEIVKAQGTSDETVETTKAITRRLGKFPVVCKDHPGFLGVRLQNAIVVEGARMLQEGLASSEDIDTAVKLTLGLRLPIMGPLRLVDLGGMDVFVGAYDYLASKLGEKYGPPEIMKDLVKQGRLGIKKGGGFYTYTPEEAARIVKERDEWLIQKSKELKAKNP